MKRVYLFGFGLQAQIQGVDSMVGVLLACTYVCPFCAQPTFRFLNYNKFTGSVKSFATLTNINGNL